MASPLAPATVFELFEKAPCGYVLCEADGMLTSVNETFLRWTGYSKSELEGYRRFQELLSPASAIFYETHCATLLSMQGILKQISLELVCSSGEVLPVLLNSAMYPAADGSPASIVTTLFDVRERKRYERELLIERRNAEQLAAVMEHTSDAIVTTTPELIVTNWNPAAQKMFGYTQNYVIGRDYRTLVVPENCAHHFETELSKVRAGQSVQYEAEQRNTQARVITVSVTVSPHIEAPDELVGFVFIIRDVTVRKTLERAEQVRRDLALANRLAHEINNPLQAIINCVGVLSSEGDRRYLSLIEQQLTRVAQVVRDLANITRANLD